MQFKNKYIVSIIMMLMIVFSQNTIGFSSGFAASGTAKIFVIEFFVFAISFYVVFLQLLVKRKIKTSSLVSKILFSLLLIFIIYYGVGLGYRYFMHQSLVGNFLLARIIIEMICLGLIIDYFSFDIETIVLGLIGAKTVGTLVQYYILFFGKGGIRGPGNMLDNSVTEYAFVLMLYPLLIFSIFYFKGIIKYLSYFNVFLNIPTIILSGSRVAFPLMIFLSLGCLAYIFFKINRKFSIPIILSITLVSIVSLLVIGTFSTNDNKQALARSISVPISMYNKVTPKSMNFNINKLSKPAYVSKRATKKRNVEETIELSNDMRYEINSRSKKIIMKNPKNFFLGVGASSVPALNGHQKPHNLILLYMLPFGLIGTIICYIIIFSPLLFSIKKKINLNSLFLICMSYFPIIIIGLNQPILGTMIICFTLYTLTFTIYKNSDTFKDPLK